MKTLLLIIAAAVLFFVIVIGLSLWEILKLKKRELQKTTENETDNKKPETSIMGESKSANRQFLSIPAKACKDDAKEQQGTKKPLTFADNKHESEDGISTVPDEELEEIKVDVDVSDEIPNILKCFDEEPETITDGGVMAKELVSLNRLLKKGRLSDDEKGQLSDTVSKIDGTRFFDSILEKFTHTTQGKLLEGFRQKIREHDMALSESKTDTTVPSDTAKEMNDEELEKYIQ